MDKNEQVSAKDMMSQFSEAGSLLDVEEPRYTKVEKGEDGKWYWIIKSQPFDRGSDALYNLKKWQEKFRDRKNREWVHYYTDHLLDSITSGIGHHIGMAISWADKRVEPKHTKIYEVSVEEWDGYPE